jgi:hypothetical protein
MQFLLREEVRSSWKIDLLPEDLAWSGEGGIALNLESVAKSGSIDGNVGRFCAVVQVFLLPDLFPELSKRHLFIIMLVEYFRSRQIKIFLRDVHSSLPQRVHARLSANTLQLSP